MRGLSDLGDGGGRVSLRKANTGACRNEHTVDADEYRDVGDGEYTMKIAHTVAYHLEDLVVFS